MFNLNRNKNYTIFDIGNSKIACVTFKISGKKAVIVGMDHKKSKGIKKNRIIDPNLLSTEIEKVYKIANKNIKINSSFSNITDTNIFTKKSYTELETQNFAITKKKIREIYKKNVAELNIKGRSLIHSFPDNFYLDKEKIVKDALGEKCKKFGFSSFNLLSDSRFLDDFKNCFTKKNIPINNFFDSGVASAISNLTENEKISGSVCIDIGAFASKVVVFLKNKIIYVKNIPLGGDDVTSDISKGLEISEEAAEVNKIVHGNLNTSYNETIEIIISPNKKKKISKNVLYGIIKPRYDEILEIIRDDLFDNIYARIGINNIVLTGGASKIFGIDHLSERLFNRKSRIGKIHKNNSFFYNKPEFSTLLGLIELTKNLEISNISSHIYNNKFLSIFDRFDNWIEDSYA